MDNIWWNYDVNIELILIHSFNFNPSSHILLCNLLTVILRPNFDEPFDTAKQLAEKNITVWMQPYSEGWKNWFQTHPIPEYQELGKNIFLADDDVHFYDLTKQTMNDSYAYAYVNNYLNLYQIAITKHLNHGRGWYRSKEKLDLGLSPFSGYIVNKNWHLIEVKYILRNLFYNIPQN